ncbi:phytoene dehydrogenase-like protein [Streptomyces phaeoluteigriseus]
MTRERTATFAPNPGVGRLRPGARTKASGLYLAGAWTATGWPATMESAVRSGVSAADAALGALGRPRPRHLFAFEEAAHCIVPGDNPRTPGREPEGSGVPLRGGTR